MQGVRFRNSVRKFAICYGLRGSVMNLPNGGILIIVQVYKKRLEKLISWIWKSPGFSKVEKTNRKENKNYKGISFSRTEMLYTSSGFSH